jgi:glycosyltransferase involved in cell wall biosynthesis
MTVDFGTSRSPAPEAAPSAPTIDRPPLRIAINLLTDDPEQPSGAHWCWNRLVPAMADRLLPGEELHLMVSPAMRHYFPDHRDTVRYLNFPYSNEHRVLRTASEHLMTPFLLPLRHIDLLSTAIAPVVNPTRSLVIHMKTMHAFTAPDSLDFWSRTYRRLNYQRSIQRANIVIVNSKSLQAEIENHLHLDPRKVRLIYEAVDHDIFKPGDRDSARARVAKLGVTRPFVLFISSLWRYKNCHGLLQAWRLVRDELAGRQLVIVGAERDERYASELRDLIGELGIGEDVIFAGSVPNEETAEFYRAADLLVYPSFNETFGLPILEAMACACPVVTSSISSMPEIAGGAAILADPHDPSSLARSMLEACGVASSRLRTEGLLRAQQFTWAATAQATLDAYREAAELRHK